MNQQYNRGMSRVEHSHVYDWAQKQDIFRFSVDLCANNEF